MPDPYPPPIPAPAAAPRRKVADPTTLTPLAPDLNTLITRTAGEVGVNPDLLARVIRQESGGNPAAVSPKGARGLGQLMPGTAKELGVNPDQPVENVRGAATYLKQMLEQFGGDETKALAAYNAGPGAVQKYGGVPPYRETQGYVAAIQGGAVPRRKVAAPDAVQVLQPGQAVPPPPAPGVVGAGQVGQVGQAAPPAQVAQPALPQGVDPRTAHPLAQLGYGLLDTATGLITRPLDTAQRAASAVGSTLSNAASTAYQTVAPYFNSAESIRSTARTALPTAGTFVGGALGARGGWTGAMAGAGVGAGTGELAAMGVEALTGAPPSLEDVRRRSAEAFATGAGSELAGQAITGAAGKALRPMANKLTTVGKEAILKYGHQFTPAQVVDSRGATIAENIAKGSLFGGGKYHEFLEGQQKFFDQERQRLIDAYGGFNSPERVGQAVQAARKAGLERFQGQAAEKYAKVAELAGDAQIPMEDLGRFASQELEKRGALPGEVSGNTGMRLLKQVGAASAPKKPPVLETSMGSTEDLPPALHKALVDAGVIPEGGDLPPTLTYQQAHFFRSELQGLIRNANKTTGTDDRLVGVAKQLSKRLDASIDASLPPEAQAAYREANQFYREGQQQYNSKFLREVAKANPEAVVDKIVKDGDVTNIRAVRDAVDPVAWKKIQGLTVERLLTDRTGQPAAGKDVVKGLSDLTKPTLRELFPGAEDAEVQQYARILEQIQGRREGTGKMWVQLTQASAVAALAGGGKVRTAAMATLAVPKAISTLFTSELGRKWLTTGFSAPPGSAAFTRASVDAAAFLAREATHEGQRQGYKEAWKDGPAAPPPGAPPGPPRQPPPSGPR